MSEFKLHIETQEIQDASVKIGWCLTKEIMRKLEKMRIDKLYVLLIWGKGAFCGLQKKIVPYESFQTFITFNRPGRTLIRAFVFWKSKNEESEAAKIFLSDPGDLVGNCDNGEGGIFLFRDKVSIGFLYQELSDFEQVRKRDDCKMIFDLFSDGIEVLVPEGVFAKKPWDYGWLTLFLKKDLRDQCHARKLRPFAYTIQPFIFILYILFNFLARGAVIFFHLGCGRKGIRYSPLWRIFSEDVSEIGEDLEESVFYVKTGRVEGEEIKKFPLWFPLSPLVWLPFLVLFLCFHHNGLEDVSFGLFLAVLMVIPFFILSFSLFSSIILAYRFLDKYSEKEHRERRRKKMELQREKKEQEEKRKIEDYYKPLEGFSCGGKSPLNFPLSQMPKKQAIRLIFTGIKRKVCKPFAK